MRSPDVTYVSLGKLPEGRSPETFGEVIPDLAVEVLSPCDSLKELGRKGLGLSAEELKKVWEDPFPDEILKAAEGSPVYGRKGARR